MQKKETMNMAKKLSKNEGGSGNGLLELEEGRMLESW
jgi:hypothetical protein